MTYSSRFMVIGAVACGLGRLSFSAQTPAANQNPTPVPPSPNQQNAPPPPGGAQNSARTPKKVVTEKGGYPEYDPGRIEQGHKLYQANCTFCHGANAKGGEGGPNLVQSLVVLDDENGNKIGQVVHNGRPEKGMPKFPFSDDQILDIATFLHEQVKAAALRGNYKVLNIVVGDAKQGEAYFNGAGKCTGCHSVTGDLAHIGAKYEPVDVQQHIVLPREGRGKEVPGNQKIKAAVTLPSGETVSGDLDHIDDFTVSLIDSNGEYRSFTREGATPKVELHDPLKAHTEMLMKYTDADIHNLTAYLVTLK